MTRIEDPVELELAVGFDKHLSLVGVWIPQSMPFFGVVLSHAIPLQRVDPIHCTYNDADRLGKIGGPDKMADILQITF